MGMLKLRRSHGEKIRITSGAGEHVVDITVGRISPTNAVTLVFEADSTVLIDRPEYVRKPLTYPEGDLSGLVNH